MPKAFKRGELFEWNSEAGRVQGVIVRKLVSEHPPQRLYAPRLETAIRHRLKTDHVIIHKGPALRHLRVKKR